MYIKKEIQDFVNKMPKETKLQKEWKDFIKQNSIQHNLLIEHKKEEYQCTNCGKYSYGKLLNERNFKYQDICRFCGNKYVIRRSNLKNYFFSFNLAMIDNISNKLVIRYFNIYRYYNNKMCNFSDSIAEFARYVPEFDVILLNNRCPLGQNIYHYDKVKKWRVFKGQYYANKDFQDIYIKDVDEKAQGTSYQYIPLGDAVNHLKSINYNTIYRMFELVKYESFELLLKAGLYNLAFNCPERFNEKGSFEKRFGVKKNFYNFMKKHDISYEELRVLQLTQRTNIEVIRRLLKMSNENIKDLERTNNYIDLVRLEEYSKKKCDFSIPNYLDYIDNLERIGIPLTKKKLLPENFSEAHDLSVKKVKIVENKNLDKKIKQRYKQLEKNNYRNKSFFIRPAKTLKDIKDESVQQKNCVYSNYSEKYANGDTDIYFLRKLKDPNKSLVTVEVLNGKIRQKYQKQNTSVTKAQKEFLNLWEKDILNAA